jgi:Fic family protein
MTLYLPVQALRYIAEEVRRQGDVHLAVAWMAEAWDRAMLDKVRREPVTPELIERWGRLVSPEANADGFRTSHVRVGTSLTPPPLMVREIMARFCKDDLTHLTPDVAYLHFEKIHPFRDGNGRTGKILLNYLNGTLDAPVMPSNWFGVSNP